MSISSCRLNACLLLVSIGLAACGSGEKKDAGQVAAKVNGKEISAGLLNQAISQTPGVTEANVAQARKAILDRLIVQQLAVEKATEAKLDRTTQVIMALDMAHRDILAKAYMEQVSSSATNVDKTDIRHYFDDHPDLFAQRRLYSLTDIALKSDDKLIATLKDMVAANKSMQDIAQYLKDNNAVFEAHNYNSAAEQLPLDLLPSIAKLSDGQTAVIPAGQVVHVINVIKSKQEPVTFEVASPQIQKYLSAERRQQLILAEIKRLKDTAKIEYLGEYSADKPVAAPAAKPAAPAGALDVSKGIQGIK